MDRVFYGGDAEFNALVFGEQHPATVAHLYQQLAAPTEHLSAAAQQFVAASYELFERYHGAEAQRQAQAAIAKVKGTFQPDSVQALYDLVMLQQAQPQMQRWIMTDPLIRQAYFEQRIDGFADTYVDHSPGQVGEAHYDWRRLHEGVFMPVEGNPEYDWEHVEWAGDAHPDDRELTLAEKMDIFSTIEFARAYLLQGKDDPTSPVGGKL